jgi:hypothetical protein
MTIELDDLETPQKRDFRRANGAPQVVIDGKNERFSRPSGWGKDLDDQNALVNWRIDTAVRGVAGDPAIQARAVAAKEDDRDAKAAVREAAIQAGRGNQASDIGTALHAMSERWEQEPTWDPGLPFRTSLEAYSAEMTRLGLESELFEYHVVNVEYRAAGTCDRLYRLTRPLVTPSGEILPEGTLVVGDLKTGKKLDFSLPGYTVQMAIYANGEFYDVVHDVFMPTPDVNKDWGILVHMPADAGTCNFQWVDLTAGNYGAYLVHEVREWRKNWRSGHFGAPDIVDPVGMTGAEIAAALDATIVEGKIETMPEWPQPDEDEDWIKTMTPFIQNRMRKIRDNPEAMQHLVTFWPSETPSPKAGFETTEQVTAVLSLLDKTEAKFCLPFPSDDPRGSTNGHKSAGPVSNTPKEKATT